MVGTIEEIRRQKPVDNKVKSRNRSSTGCLTCRRRKKKCDEKSYPQCLTCEDKQLQCEWPAKVNELHRHLSNVRYYGVDDVKENHQPPKSSDIEHIRPQHTKSKSHTGISNFADDVTSYNEPSVSDLLINDFQLYTKEPFDLVEGNVSDVPVTVPITTNTSYSYTEDAETKRKNVLKRIALQQDCVDEL